MRVFETANAAGHARRSPSDDAIARRLTARVQIHVTRSRARGLLTKIDEGGAAIGHADEHETAPANIAGERIRYRQGETDGDGGVNSITPSLKNRDANIGCVRLLCDNHYVARADRLARTKDGTHATGGQERSYFH